MIDQFRYWNGVAGERWVREQEERDALLCTFGEAALEAARVGRGESVLDVGCGCGDTSLALAGLVGPGGSVVGLDLSAPMLLRARERSASHANVSFLECDAALAPLDGGSFDLVYSRFGVMFFSDPTKAFAHVRSALRPKGRVSFACWRPLDDNPWAKVPFDAAASVLGRPEPVPTDAPGPFSFGDAARVRAVLQGAGFHEVTLRPFDTSNSFGGSGSLANAAHQIARLGPVARLLFDRDESAVRAALAAIEAVLPPYANSRGGVSFPAAAWVVHAENRPPK